VRSSNTVSVTIVTGWET